VPLASATSKELDAEVMLASPDPLPPPGVDVGAFLGLLRARRSGAIDNLFEIDKAANNTSVALLQNCSSPHPTTRP